MKKFEPTLEHAFYALALAIAVGLRFVQLGVQPLSDYEAGWALQSLRIIQGLKPAIGPNPAYVHLTAILFYIFGPTDFLARFWPALAGCILVLSAWLLRARIGRIPALILAFGLAIDPGLVAMSHLAGGPMLAVTCLVLDGVDVDGWSPRRRRFLCRPGAAFRPIDLAGVARAGIGLGIRFGRWKKSSCPGRGKNGCRRKQVRARHASLRRNCGWRFTGRIGTLIIAGSLFFLSPKGLPAFIVSLGTFLRGWYTLSDVQLWRPLLALPAYEILPLIFGIAAAVRGF